MELSFGQKIDPENNLVMPWFTHKALDEIADMDLRDKNIFEYGAGLGDIWLSKRCKELRVVERKEIWFDQCMSNKFTYNADNLEYIYRPCNDSDGQAEMYLEIPEDFEPDIIISDDAFRTEAVRKAIDYFKSKNKEGIFIADNWFQDYVWISPIVNEWTDMFERHIHLCDTHKDHEGNPWKTAIIYIK